MAHGGADQHGHEGGVVGGDRYRASGRAERSKILDEFAAVTGYHRKHAIRLLRPKAEPLELQPRRVYRRYSGDVREALIVLWEASDRLCSKRLKPIVPVLLPALERHGQLSIDEVTREQLLAIGPATIDRLLSEVRLVARGGRRRRAGFSSAVRRTVPVRTFGDWSNRRVRKIARERPFPSLSRLPMLVSRAIILQGRQPIAFTATRLTGLDLPLDWSEQRGGAGEGAPRAR